jgi:D-arabinose 1-dehydrogenase-like Zn-dependent alcohol dehydrogenase
LQILILRYVLPLSHIERQSLLRYQRDIAACVHYDPRRDRTESDVQIEILFCGICHSDLHQVRNEWSGVMPTVYPCVPGHEIVGRVTKVGPAVTKFKVGDLAAVGCLVDSDGTCPDCKQGFEQFCPNLTLTYNFPDKHTGGCKTRATVSIRFSRRRVTSSPATISTSHSWN